MPLTSEFKRNRQLLACAESDPAHIGRQFNAKGEHVKLIRKALNAWLDRENLNPKPARLNEAVDIYDEQVAKRVALYKSTKRIFNFRGQIDDIVGIKTVDALDKELPIELDPIDIESSFMDVIVHFAGALTDTPRALTEDEVMPFGLLFRYMVNKIVPKTRKLIRIGNQTTGFGPATQSIRTTIINKLFTERGEEFTFGQVFVFGSSSGGRNAIEFTNEFTARGGNVRYLAVSDPAFFPQDTQTVPDLVPIPTNIPVFAVNASARDRKNFFQTAGNQSEKRTFSDQKIFVSDMVNKEIHGEIPGFLPVNQTALVAPKGVGLTGRNRADTLHIECTKFALPRIHSDIALVLNNLP